MYAYVVLLRGINVGGKNKVPMATLKKCLEELGYSDVSTFIASGNVLLRSEKTADKIRAEIESALPRNFKLDSELVKVLVLTRKQLQAMIDKRPKGFGDQPGKYHSDALFLIDISAATTMPLFKPREGVDKVWAGKGVIYSQRLSAERVHSRLNVIASTPAYKSITIRNWNTTTTLLDLLIKMERKAKGEKK